MKTFIKKMKKDYQEESFTKLEWTIYGVLAPVLLIAVMALAGWIESF